MSSAPRIAITTSRSSSSRASSWHRTSAYQIGIEEGITLQTVTATHEGWHFRITVSNDRALERFHTYVLENDVDIELRQLYEQSAADDSDRSQFTVRRDGPTARDADRGRRRGLPRYPAVVFASQTRRAVRYFVERGVRAVSPRRETARRKHGISRGDAVKRRLLTETASISRCRFVRTTTARRRGRRGSSRRGSPH